MRIKRGDFVRVITGKYRNIEGQVIKVLVAKAAVYLEAIKSKKHVKPSQGETKGQIKEVYRPVHISNVMILDKSKKVTTRVGYRIESGRKVRFAKKKGKKLVAN